MDTSELKLMQQVHRLVNHTNKLLRKLSAKKVALNESVSQLQKSLDGANARWEELEARLERLQRQRDGPVTSADIRLDNFAIGGRFYEPEPGFSRPASWGLKNTWFGFRLVSCLSQLTSSTI